MADVIPTNLKRGNLGSLKVVSGDFTEVDSDMEINTGLKRIIWLMIRAVDATAGDVTADIFYNSKSASSAEDDGGWFHIPDDQLVPLKKYAFEAVGK